MIRPDPEPVGEIAALLGESPSWDAGTDTLLWVDIASGEIHRTIPATGATFTRRLDPPVSMVCPAAHGRLVVAVRHQIIVLDPDGGSRVLATVAADQNIRFNDGKYDPAGRLWAGTMHLEKRPGTAYLYRLDTTGSLTPVVHGVTVSNGLGWSPDGRILYFVDTPTLRIDAFDYDVETGAISGRRTFADLTGAGGRPDGLTVDADGGVWVALFAGAALHRYTAQGHLDVVVDMPVSHPTSCAFGGADLRDLYVTTARAPLSPSERDAQPLAGRLLRLRREVPGITRDRAGLYLSGLRPDLRFIGESS